MDGRTNRQIDRQTQIQTRQSAKWNKQKELRQRTNNQTIEDTTRIRMQRDKWKELQV